MPQNQDKTRSVITIGDERLGLPNSVFLEPGSYTLNPDGSILINGGVTPGDIPADLVLQGVLTPAQLPDSTTDDWDAGDLSTAAVIEVDTAGANAALSGLDATTAVAGQLIIITNVGAFDLTLLNANGGSAAANQFALNGDKVIPAGTSYMIRRPSAAAFWSGVGA